MFRKQEAQKVLQQPEPDMGELGCFKRDVFTMLTSSGFSCPWEGKALAFGHREHFRTIARSTRGLQGNIVHRALPEFIKMQMKNNSFWKHVFGEQHR